MKKIAIIIAVVMSAFVVTRAVQGETNLTDNWFHRMPFYHTSEGEPYNREWCHGRVYDNERIDYTYTWLYYHLSIEDRAIVDQEYAELLQTHNFTSMTLAEIAEIIDQIELELIDYILDNFDTPRWD